MVFNDSLQIFSKSKVNYPNNNSSKSNLHKLITENSLHIGKSIGLVVDKGVFDDPNSGELRKSLYPRMGYLFRFRNELKLFSEVGNAKKFEIIILNKPDNNGSVHFNMISKHLSNCRIVACNQPEKPQPQHLVHPHFVVKKAIDLYAAPDSSTFKQNCPNYCALASFIFASRNAHKLLLYRPGRVAL